MKEPDTLQTRVKGNKPFYFRLRFDELQRCVIAIRFDLKSMDEINMEIKEKSLLKDVSAPLKHLEIAFMLFMSTQNEKPCEFQDETHRFSDSNQISYKVPSYEASKFLYLAIKAEKDCILTTTATVTSQHRGTRHRTNSLKSQMHPNNTDASFDYS